MSAFTRLSFLFLFLTSSLAFGQSTTQEDLGSIPASQAYLGFGWQLATNEAEYAAAAAAGASHVRVDNCTWSAVEQQSAPPNNVSLGYSLPSECASALAYAKKYGMHPTVIAAYGAPYHQILTLTLESGVAAGATSLPVEYTAGLGGDSLSTIAYPNDYVMKANGSQISKKYSYDGTLITGMSMKGTNTATLTLASALTQSLPAGTSLIVNEVLYSSPATGDPSSTSVQAFTRYAEYLANQITAYGLTGDVELWNEPPWTEDCWDNQVDCYDSDPKLPNELKGNTGNIGFPAALQATTPIPGVKYTWAGTNKSGSADLLGGTMLTYAGVSYIEPQPTVTEESFHPYGSNPEDSMWNEPCLLANPSAAQKCNTIPASESNFVNAAANSLIAQEKNASYGIGHVITETGASTLYMPSDHMARFMTRQYLGFMADGYTAVEFYRLYDTSEPGQTGFGFMTSTDGGSTLVPLPAYTAMSGLMADLGTMSVAPVTSYSSSTLPSVTSYSGTYNLDHLALVGARKGDTANSILYVLWQRSYFPQSCVDNDTSPCWGTLAQPAAGPTVVTIPGGVKVAQVINLDTRAEVSYTQSGSQIKLGVSDDPVEIMLVPSSDSTSALDTPALAFVSIAAQMQGSTVSVFANSNSPGAISYSVVSGPGRMSGNTVAFTGTGTVVLKATQVASGNYSAATATTSVAVNGVVPALAFVPITPKTFGNTLVVLAASASPGAVTYSVTSGPASVSGNAATMTGAGTVTLGASQAPSGMYTAATATISFPVAPVTPTLSFANMPINVTYGTNVPVSAKSASAGAITYSIVSGPAQISGTVITPTSEGEVYVLATQAAQGGYTAATATAAFHVNAATPNLTFTSISAQGYNVNVTLSVSTPSKGAITYSIVSGPARISGSTVTTLSSPGTVVVKAYQAASGGYAAATATTSFTVASSSSETPKLIFASIPAQAYGNPAFAVSATSASSGAVTYSVSSGPATIAGNTVTLTGAGTVVLTASQAASGNYSSASASTSFSVSSETPKLIFASIPAQAYGNPAFAVSATSASSGAVTYSVSNGPATIAGNTVTLTGAGTVVLTASQGASGNYSSASASTSFSVSSETPKLIFASIPAQAYGNPAFAVSATSASSGAVTYSVSNGPATIAGNTVTLTGAGTVVLTASQGASGNYSSASASTSFSVSSETPKLIFASIPAQAYGNPAFAVSATSASSGAVTYSVSNGPATIAGNTVTLTGAGTVVLTASQAASGNYSSASASTSFSVSSETPKLIFASIPAQAYGNPAFAVSATSASSGAVTYSVSNGPATIAGNTVTLTGAGTVVLTASQGASGNYSSASASTSFSVSSETPKLIFASIPAQAYGNPAFAVSATSASNGAVTYSVSNGPATIAGNTVTLTGAGTVVLTASQAASGNYSSASASTSFSVLNSVLTIASISSKVVGNVFTVSATSLSSGAISYSVLSGPAIITGNTVTVTGAGAAMLRASQAASGNYPAEVATTSFTAINSSALTFESIGSQTYGTGPITVSATSTSNAPITYAVISGPAFLSGTMLTITGTGTVMLQANQASTSTYAAATANISFPVVPETPALTFGAVSPQTPGAVFTVNATSPSYGAIHYSVLSGPATISGTTVTTLSTPGTVTLQAQQAASGNYTSTTAVMVFQVTQNTSTLTFSSIASQYYGDVFAVSTYTASKGPISYSVISGPATINGNVVTLTGVGTVVLQASQAAFGAYPASTATTTVPVLPLTPTLTFTPITPKTFGNVLGVRATSVSSAAVTYSVISGPATITGETVTMTGSGNVVLGASQAPTVNYAGTTASITFPVSPDPEPLTFNNITPKTVGDTFGILALSDSPGSITYSVLSGPAFLNGTTITITGAGTITLQAQQAASGVYPAAHTSISFPVAVAQ